MSGYMTPTEAAQHLRVSKQRIHQLAQGQKWKSIKLGNRIGYEENYVIFSRLLSRPPVRPKGQSVVFNELARMAEALGYRLTRKSGGLELSKEITKTVTRHYAKLADVARALENGYPLPEHTYRLHRPPSPPAAGGASGGRKR